MLSRTDPRHACETPLIQGSAPGHTWACSCGRTWTIRHRIGEYGGHLTWDPERTAAPVAAVVAWMRGLRSRRVPAHGNT